MAKSKHKPKDNTMDGLGVSFEEALSFLSNPKPRIEPPLKESVNQLTKSLLEVGKKHGMNPPENIFQYFSFRVDEPFTYWEAKNPNLPEITNECFALYRYYFPEGR